MPLNKETKPNQTMMVTEPVYVYLLQQIKNKVIFTWF